MKKKSLADQRNLEMKIHDLCSRYNTSPSDELLAEIQTTNTNYTNFPQSYSHKKEKSLFFCKAMDE